MTGVFEHMLDALPCAAVFQTLENELGVGNFKQASLAQLGRHFAYVKPAGACRRGLPDARKIDRSLSPALHEIWGWKWDMTTPYRVFDVDCLVRDADFSGFRVLSQVQFGLEQPQGTFRPVVELTTTTDQLLELPLEEAFVHSAWLVKDGEIRRGRHPLWKLPALPDQSLVVVFWYTVTETGQVAGSSPGVVPGSKGSMTEAQREALDQVGKHLEKLDWQAPTALENVVRDMQTDAEVPEFAKRLMDDDWMPSARGAKVGGAVGEVREASVTEPRFLVIMSFGVDKERANFEPGAIAGMGRVNPHLMVKGSVPLRSIRCSIQFDRPEQTRRVSGTTDCCGPLDVMLPDIRANLFADTNSSASMDPGSDLLPPVPFWSHLFNNFVVDAHAALQAKRLKMVRPDKGPRARIDIVERAPAGTLVAGSSNWLKGKVVSRLAHQGSFDNIHVAPPMSLGPAVDFIRFGLGKLHALTAADRTAMQLDTIAMAPICAHDCFHMHWRWSDRMDQEWVWGFGPEPYSKPGAPMVPPHQEVVVWTRAPAAFTYHVNMVRPVGKETLPGTWEIFCHHGGAYALSVVDYVKWLRFALDLESGVTFYTGAKKVRSDDAWSVFYWNLRYEATKSPMGATDRTKVLDLDATLAL